MKELSEYMRNKTISVSLSTLLLDEDSANILGKYYWDINNLIIAT